ncbi:adenine phosphoribosyltransferase [Rhynchophorus ferrugineus]|uniref:Adenine phosphoribosyltransferase n=1 Tax=Rhynchophorus ferrugineus TaxID=354439 RepID=A0A834HU04_RHYFE|nr:hypothetical protein GWI33_019301 [Rhynchophorus ferrugineus]
MEKEAILETLKNAVKSYPDFPIPGVIFRDLFSVLADPQLFPLLKKCLIEEVKAINPPVECVVSLDARGFLLGPIIALELGIPFIPIRKKGKLPGKVRSYDYTIEYGQSTVEIQENSVKPGQKVLVVDDLLATGGTLDAACKLIKQEGGDVVSCLVVMELNDLKGREKISANVISLLQF